MIEEKNNKFDHLFSKLSPNVQKLNSLLITVDWENIDYDAIDCSCGIKSNNLAFSEQQNLLLKTILEIIPEWNRLINCRQHSTHDYTLDIHTLQVVKKIKGSPKFKALCDYDQLILLYTALLHDMEKLENEVDPEHPLKSAEKASSVIYRLGFGEDFINDIYTLIKNHQIIGFIASDRIKLEDLDVAGIFSKYRLIDLLAIFAVADIKSVKKNEDFFNEYLEKNINSATNYIQNYLNNI